MGENRDKKAIDGKPRLMAFVIRRYNDRRSTCCHGRLVETRILLSLVKNIARNDQRSRS
jgi:hypothetical protein